MKVGAFDFKVPPQTISFTPTTSYVTTAVKFKRQSKDHGFSLN